MKREKIVNFKKETGNKGFTATSLVQKDINTIKSNDCDIVKKMCKDFNQV